MGVIFFMFILSVAKLNLWLKLLCPLWNFRQDFVELSAHK